MNCCRKMSSDAYYHPLFEYLREIFECVKYYINSDLNLIKTRRTRENV